MARKAKSNRTKHRDTGALPAPLTSRQAGNLGFEDKLWAAAEYKHVVLGLIFLKYISDAFLEKHEWLIKESSNPQSEYFVKEEQARYGIAEDPDEYLADNVFWVPPEARWGYLQKNAKRPEIGKLVDEAMTAIERDNKTLKGVLPKDYARPALNKVRLGEIIDLIATIGLGDKESRQKDILGRVYEYFLARFAAAEGKLGGQFYTPQYVVKLLVEMIEPYKGRVFDPCCGSGGMFVSAVKFVQAHASNNDLSACRHAQAGADRHDGYGQVVLVGCLRDALFRINQYVPTEALRKVGCS